MSESVPNGSSRVYRNQHPYNVQAWAPLWLERRKLKSGVKPPHLQSAARISMGGRLDAANVCSHLGTFNPPLREAS
jgi:hypothetical protein